MGSTTPDGDPTRGYCQWPTQSYWHQRACGRVGVSRSSRRFNGPILCWQHDEIAVEHVIASIESGAVSRIAIEDLCLALVRSVEVGQIKAKLSVEFWQTISRLDPDAIDTLIRKRVEDKWSVA